MPYLRPWQAWEYQLEMGGNAAIAGRAQENR